MKSPHARSCLHWPYLMDRKVPPACHHPRGATRPRRLRRELAPPRGVATEASSRTEVRPTRSFFPNTRQRTSSRQGPALVKAVTTTAPGLRDRMRVGGTGVWTANRVPAGEHLGQNGKRQLDGQVLDRLFTDKAFRRTPPGRSWRNSCGSPAMGLRVVQSMDRLASYRYDLRALVQGLTRRRVRVFVKKGAWSSPARTPPLANSPSWVPSRIERFLIK